MARVFMPIRRSTMVQTATMVTPAREFLVELTGEETVRRMERMLDRKPMTQIDWRGIKRIIANQLRDNNVSRPYNKNAAYAIATLAMPKINRPARKTMKDVFAQGGDFEVDFPQNGNWCFAPDVASTPGVLLPLPKEPSTPEGVINPKPEPKTTPFKPEPKPDPEDIDSVKWIPWWAHRAKKPLMEALLRGYRFADGSEAMDRNVIFCSSYRVRDQLVRLMLHAGYSVSFYFRIAAGEVSTVLWGKRVIYAKHDGWGIKYHKHDDGERFPSRAARVLFHKSESVITKKYTGPGWTCAEIKFQGAHAPSTP